MMMKMIPCLGILFLLIIFPSIKSEECENHIQFTSHNCYCGYVNVGIDRPLVNIHCQGPKYRSNRSIILPEMKYLVLNQLVISNALMENPLEPIEDEDQQNELICNGRNEQYHDWRCRVKEPEYKSYSYESIPIPSSNENQKLELPRITDFRVGEIIIRDSKISKSFLNDLDYFAHQEDFLTHFTMNNCSLQGVLTSSEDVLHNEENTIKLGALDYLPKLYYLDFSGNRISKITSLAFKDSFSSLRHLYLRKNEISEIESYAFSNLTTLETLDLSSNKLTKIDDNIFPTALNRLKYLSFRNNEITEIDGGIFENINSLEKVDFKFNFIHEIPSQMWMSNSLRYLDLSGNFVNCGFCPIRRRSFNALSVAGLCTRPLSTVGLTINQHYKSVCNSSTVAFKENANSMASNQSLHYAKGTLSSYLGP